MFRMYKMFYNLRIHAISCILFFLTFFRFVSSLYASSTGNRGIHDIYNYRYAFIICYIQRRKRKTFTAYHIRRTNQLYILFHLIPNTFQFFLISLIIFYSAIGGMMILDYYIKLLLKKLKREKRE